MKSRHFNSRGMMLLVLALAAGCTSDSVLDRKIARYRPDAGSRDVSAWQAVANAEKTPEGTPAGVKTPEPEKDPVKGAFWARPLRRGDKVMVYLRGIPVPEEKPDIVDDKGEISLPLVRKVRIEGMTTSEAEDQIEKAFLDGGFYKNIAVTIVAQEDEYFIRGEVKRPGRFPLRPGMTLLQAITGASGYTEFAKTGKIQIIRADKKLHYDAEKIEEGEEKDPVIKPGDIIVVGRRWFL